jgi:hypothetical protein
LGAKIKNKQTLFNKKIAISVDCIEKKSSTWVLFQLARPPVSSEADQLYKSPKGLKRRLWLGVKEVLWIAKQLLMFFTIKCTAIASKTNNMQLLTLQL